MTRLKVTFVALAAGAAMAATPAFAQRTRPADSSSSGSAVARGGSAAPAPSAPSPSAAGASSAGTFSSPSAATPTHGSASPSAGVMHRAPMAFAPQRRAVPRGATSTGTASPRSAGAASSPSGNRGPHNAAEVPSWGRPHGSHPTTGTAVGRTTPPPARGNVYSNGYYYNPYYGGYYSPYVLPYFVPGAYGLGLDMYFDPWMMSTPYGYGSPYGYGGYGFDPYGYSSGYGSGGGYSYSTPAQQSEDQGSVRLKIKPRDAQVYVDGYLVGSVDQFDGIFQKLTLTSGPHEMEVRANGYAPQTFKVLVTPNDTVTYEGDLKKIQ
ncbi:MAG TPA: PEGA domain-containing protein [Vicinamibacterales bacterium]|nr:PEGA domain-containing protein [Vicinamibacterales bacterium]